MAIDFQKLITSKVDSMEKEGIIASRIETNVEKLINSVVDDAIGSYEMRKAIRSTLEKDLDHIAESISLDAYSGFIIQRCKSVIEEHMSADIAEKVASTLSDTLFAPISGEHTLSGILKKYHQHVEDTVVDEDKFDSGGYLAKMNVRKSYFSNDEIIELRLGLQVDEDPDILISITDRHSQVFTNTITGLTISGMDMRKSCRIGYLDSFERYICQLYFNRIPIIVDDVDIDEFGSYEINY